MTNIENLKNWIEALEYSNEFLLKIKEYLNTNLDKNFKYDLYESTVDGSDDYDLIDGISLKIIDKNNPKSMVTFNYHIDNLPTFYKDMNEDSDDYDDDYYPDYKVSNLSDEQKEEVLQKYNDAFNEFTKLDLKNTTNNLLEYDKNGLVFLNNKITFKDGNLILQIMPINQAKIILKDDVLYFIKDKNNMIYNEEYLKSLDHIDLKELNKENTFILPRLELKTESHVYDGIDIYGLSNNTSFDVIKVDSKDKKFDLVGINGLDGRVFNEKSLGNPNYKDEYIQYYLKDENKNNKEIIKLMNKQQTSSQGTITKQYPSLDTNAFLDIIKILNWRRAISLREWQLKQNGLKYVTDTLGNRSIDSFNDKQKGLIAKYKYLADTDYREIDYQAIFNEFKDEKITKHDYTKYDTPKLIIEIKEKKEKNKTR